MNKKMLIDATHAEETRVVVVEGNKVDEFDFESVTKRQLAGNIYLAKVTRVEPSLQAAFVDYGGNRHGFLAYSEVHPDYYQIPLEDRQRLLDEERALERSQAEEDESEKEAKPAPKRRRRKKADADVKADEAQAEETPAEDASDEAPVEATAESDAPADTDPAESADDEPNETIAEATGAPDDDDDIITSDDVDENNLLVDTPEDSASPKQAVADNPNDPVETPEDAKAAEKPKRTRSRSRRKKPTDDAVADETSEDNGESDSGIESIAPDDVQEEVVRRKPRQRRYKIQEVIKVRQIMLVQVVKEERGNKGAALTTYLSLAGRYCVLMPNTARGGGISRKITSPTDRKKLKEIANEIEVPEGAGLIVRTAGAKRTKTEIKRDYEYLMRLWEEVRELTLSSIAPKLIYEEGNLIKRSIRDLYSREIDEILVEGEAGYKEAKEYMKMLQPSHAKNVKQYTDPLRLFARFQVENYLGGMLNPTVQLRSGGYIVIGVTEALVAIDVNSGRATKEGSIEDTAVKTNLEAAEEIARQMRLRDLAGLLVIDFIDMEERRNNNAVEKRMKDCLKNDRARIQVGRISGFGLLEMSRQRLRPGMLEATTTQCPHCHGTGYIRTDESVALTILRELEEEGARGRSREVLVKVPISVANYMLNQKRDHVAMVEAHYALSVRIEADPSLIGSDYNVERFKQATRKITALDASGAITVGQAMPEEPEEAEVVETAEAETAPESTEEPKRRRRRRRRGRGRGGENAHHDNAEQAAEGSTQADAAPAEDEDAPLATADAPVEVAEVQETAPETAVEEKPKRKRAPRRKKAEPVAEAVDAPAEDAPAEAEAAPEEAPKPKRRAPRKKKAEVVDEVATDAIAPADAAPEDAVTAEPKAAPKKPRARKAPAKKAAAKKTPAKKAEETEAAEAAPAPAPEPEPEVAPQPKAETAPKPEAEAAPAKPERKRSGWWSRALGR